MDITIRPVREEDAQSIIGLLNPIIREGKYSVMDMPFSVDDQIGFIRSFPERGIYHIAELVSEQKILGIQDVMPISTESDVFKHVGAVSTFTALDSQHKGIGRSLSQATFKAASEKGYLKISAMVRADNPRAISFYLSLGFRIIGTAQKQAFIQGRFIDEVLMERFLTQP